MLGDDRSAKDESFSQGLLEYAQYTRPATFQDERVPEVLLSGDHGSVSAWRRRSSIERTARWRPDLLEGAELNEDEWGLVHETLGRRDCEAADV